MAGSFLTYAGYDLVRPTPELQSRLDRWWDVSAPDLWMRPGYFTRGLDHLPNPAPPPAQRAPFNTLVWPGGASRWGQMHCLIDGTNARALEQSLAGGAGSLAFADANTGKTFAASMYLIGLRPLYVGGGTDADWAGRLYWATLVDARYFWWTQTPTFSFAVGDSWATLLTNLVAAATPVIPTIPAISGAYGVPSPIRWGRPNVPLPLLIDAAAAAVALNPVFQPDGTIEFRDNAASAAADLNQFNAVSAARPPSFGGRISVAEIAGGIPAIVVVGFWGDNPTYRSVSLASLALAPYVAAGVTGVTNTNAWLSSDANAAQTSPTPASLASQMATDYYLGALSLTDATWAGVWDLKLSGLEDRIEWEWASGFRPPARGPEVDKNPLVDGGTPDVRVLSRIVRRDYGDRNLYGDRAPPGYSYVAKLTAVSGGRWKGVMQIVNPAGAVVDGPQIGFGTDGYVLFPTRADDGSVGFPQVGDRVDAIPDAFIRNAWTFIPKGINERQPSSCDDCGWFVDLDPLACLRMKQLGGEGKCFCTATDTDDGAYMFGSRDGIAWRAVKMATVCCGCGIVLFRPNNPSPLQAILELQDFHVSCQGESGDSGAASIFSYNMILACCGIDENGNEYANFIGWGPDTCFAVAPPESGGSSGSANCRQTFRIRVTCVECPPVNCDCACGPCCSGKAGPFGWWFDIPDAPPPDGFADDHWNGGWILGMNPDDHCSYFGICNPTGGVTPYESILTGAYGGDGSIFIHTLTHGGSVYQKTGWDCCGDNTLLKISGDGPNEITVHPILNADDCPDCVFDWPETLTYEITNLVLTGGACYPNGIGDTFVLTKIAGFDPISNLIYDYGGFPFPTADVPCCSNIPPTDYPLSSIVFECGDVSAGHPVLFLNGSFGIGGVQTVLEKSCTPLIYRFSFDFTYGGAPDCQFTAPGRIQMEVQITR